MFAPVSILDNDLYKFTMQQAVLQLFPNEIVSYKFINRGKTQFPKLMVDQLKYRLDNFNGLKLNSEEKNFLSDKCYYFTPSYLDFLENFKYNWFDEVFINWKDGNLDIEIRGSWYKTILWEVPLMALISETYYEITGIKSEESIKQRIRKIENKATKLEQLNCLFSEFGTRRRFSFANQEEVIDTLQSNTNNLLGTSNLYFAKKFNLTPMGTQAHEWYMFHGSMYGYKIANQIAMDNWIKVYQGNLGIALTDTYTSDVFFRSFNTYYAKLFDGIRQDSGDPIEFIEKASLYYQLARTSIEHKTILFSDALNLKKISDIKGCLTGRGFKLTDRYGIGTWLTNDLKGVKPLNMVIKLDKVLDPVSHNMISAIKLSDDIGKNTGNKKEIKICKQTLGVK